MDLYLRERMDARGKKKIVVQVIGRLGGSSVMTASLGVGRFLVQLHNKAT